MNSVDSFRDYFKAHLEEANLADIDECKEQIRQAPAPFYTLTPVDFETFRTCYEAALIRLESISFSYAVINGVQGIYHLALGILTFSKVRLYTAFRDFEEGYGRIIKIGNKTKAAFYVQRALFHKSAYEEYQKGPRIDPLVVGNVTIAHALDAKRTNFAMFIKNPEFYIAKFKLEEAIRNAGGQEFLDRLNEGSNSLLSSLSIYRFLLDPEFFSKFYLISDNEFAAITLAQIKEFNEDRLTGVWERFVEFNDCSESPSEGININAIIEGKIDPNKLVEELPPRLYGLIPTSQLDAIDLSKLDDKQLKFLLDRSDDEIEEIIRKLPLAVVRKVPNLLTHISNDQLKEFKDITIEELNAIFGCDFYVDKARFALLSKEALQSVLSKMDSKYLGAITDEQLKVLDLTPLNKEQLRNLFYWAKSLRIQLLDVKAIIALSDKLECLSNISENQLKELDFSKLSGTAIFNVLNHFDEEKKRKIIQSLSTEQLFFAIPHMNSMQTTYITDDQIKQLPFEKMDIYSLRVVFDPRLTKEATRRFDLVKDRMHDILPKLENLEWVSDDIVQNFDVSLLSRDQLKSLLRLGFFSNNPRVPILRDEQWVSFLHHDFVRYIPDSVIIKFIDKFDGIMLDSIDCHRRDLLSKLGKNELNIVLNKFSRNSFLTDEQIPLIDFSVLSDKTRSSILLHLNFGDKERKQFLTIDQLIYLASNTKESLYPTKEQIEKIDFSKLSEKAIKAFFERYTYAFVSKKQLEDAMNAAKGVLKIWDVERQKERLGLTSADLNRYRSLCSNSF